MYQTTQTPPPSIPQPLVEIIEIIDVMTEEYGLAELFETKHEQTAIAFYYHICLKSPRQDDCTSTTGTISKIQKI